MLALSETQAQKMEKAATCSVVMAPWCDCLPSSLRKREAPIDPLSTAADNPVTPKLRPELLPGTAASCPSQEIVEPVEQPGSAARRPTGASSISIREGSPAAPPAAAQAAQPTGHEAKLQTATGFVVPSPMVDGQENVSAPPGRRPATASARSRLQALLGDGAAEPLPDEVPQLAAARQGTTTQPTTEATVYRESALGVAQPKVGAVAPAKASKFVRQPSLSTGAQEHGARLHSCAAEANDPVPLSKPGLDHCTANKHRNKPANSPFPPEPTSAQPSPARGLNDPLPMMRPLTGEELRALGCTAASAFEHATVWPLVLSSQERELLATLQADEAALSGAGVPYTHSGVSFRALMWMVLSLGPTYRAPVAVRVQTRLHSTLRRVC